MNSQHLEAALRCAEQLGPVLPCCWPTAGGRCGDGRGHPEKSVGKAPLTPRGVDDATRDPAIIERLWAKWPLANASVSLEPAGLFLIDPDSDEAQREAARLGLPPTLVRVSLNTAYLYRRPPGAPITRTAHRGASRKIDLMTSGYVVTFGRHRTGCDVFIEWLGDPQPAPAWAVDWLREAVACAPVELPADLRPVPLAELRVPDWTRRLIRFGLKADPERYPSRSEAGWAAIRKLAECGHDDATIAAVLLDPHNAAGEKAREQGRKWLAGEIGRARKKPRDGIDLAEGLPAVSGTTAPLVRRLSAPCRPRGVRLPIPTGPGRAA